LRLFNGDVLSDVVDAVTTILALSSVLSGNAVYNDPVSAISDAVRRSLTNPIFGIKEHSISIILDTSKILAQKNFVLAALSDLYRLLQCVHSKDPTLQKSKEKGAKRQPSTKQILLQSKKVYFYLVWANEQTEGFFRVLALETYSEWERQNDILQNTTNILQSSISLQANGPSVRQPGAAQKNQQKPAIEEVSGGNFDNTSEQT